MANTIYDYWFVQFDFPDDKGKPYKSSGGKMVYNKELKREIPEGWEVKELGETIELTTASINPLNNPDKKYRHYSIPAFDEKGTYKIEIGNDIRSNKFLVSNNDILVSKLNPKFNRVIYPINEENMICSTEFVVLKTSCDAVKNFVYFLTRNKTFIEYCIQSAAGTSHSHNRINPTVMLQYKISYNEKIIKKYGMVIDSLIQLMIKNQNENQKLAKLRDWLLPMLMNGQVKVK